MPSTSRLIKQRIIPDVGGLMTGDKALLIVGFVVTLVSVGCLLLALPGRSVLTRYTHDVMVYLDGAHRLLSGQLPNRDFHTALGPLAYILPAIGLRVSGTYGGAMPMATVAFAVLMTPILAYICVSRLPILLAVIVSSYFILLIIAPHNPGEFLTSVTYAMFYNRFCWVALGLLFLLYIPPRKTNQERIWPDIVCGTVLVIIMFYMKVSYAAFAVAFLGGLSLYPRTSRLAVGVLALSALVVIGVEVAWQSTLSYFSDIVHAARVSDVIRTMFVDKALLNIHDAMVIALILGICILCGLRVVDLIACAFMVGAGLIIVNQNAQSQEIVTLIPAAVVAICMSQYGRRAVGLGQRSYLEASLLTLLLAMPYMLYAAGALAIHVMYGARAHQSSPVIEPLENIIVRERIEGDLLSGEQIRAIYEAESADLPQIAALRTLRPKHDIFQTEYIITVRDGLELLRNNPDLGGTVLVLDLSNPFSAFLRRIPPRGDSSWHHFARTFTRTTFLPPDRLFSDVAVVMEPKDPAVAETAFNLKAVYGDYLAAHYDLAKESTYWRAWLRKQ